MKGLIFALIPTMALAADLTPETCNTPGAQCQNEPVAGETLIYSPQYGRVLHYTATEVYDSGMYAVPVNATHLSAVPMYAPDGSVEYLTATFTTYRTCSKYCLTHWVLQSGSVQ